MRKVGHLVGRYDHIDDRRAVDLERLVRRGRSCFGRKRPPWHWRPCGAQAGGPKKPPWSTSKKTRRARRLGFPRRVLATRLIAPSTSLKKEPGASLRLVDPYFDQTRARHIPTLAADSVRLAHGCGEELRDDNK